MNESSESESSGCESSTSERKNTEGPMSMDEGYVSKDLRYYTDMYFWIDSDMEGCFRLSLYNSWNVISSGCCICEISDATDVDPLVYCDECNLAVHKLCYGISQIPDGDWFCNVVRK